MVLWKTPLYLHPHKYHTMDIIYLLIATPVTIAVMYGSHCVKKALRKTNDETPEAEPYKFERDEYRPEFDEFTQMLVQRRMYKGRVKL